MAVFKPFWDIFPSTPTEAVVRTLDEPTVSPVGLFGLGFGKKTIIKQGSKLGVPIALGAGWLIGSLFGGGGTQEQKQAVDLTQRVQPQQFMEFATRQRPEQKTAATLITETITTIAPVTNLTAGGDIGYYSGGIYTGTETVPTVAPSQAVSADPYLPQITVIPTSIGQAQEATQKPDNTLLLIIGAVAIGAMFLMKGK